MSKSQPAVGDLVTYLDLLTYKKVKGRVSQVAKHGQALLVESYEPYRTQWVASARAKKARK